MVRAPAPSIPSVRRSRHGCLRWPRVVRTITPAMGTGSPTPATATPCPAPALRSCRPHDPRWFGDDRRCGGRRRCTSVHLSQPATAHLGRARGCMSNRMRLDARCADRRPSGGARDSAGVAPRTTTRYMSSETLISLQPRPRRRWWRRRRGSRRAARPKVKPPARTGPPAGEWLQRSQRSVRRADPAPSSTIAHDTGSTQVHPSTPSVLPGSPADRSLRSLSFRWFSPVSHWSQSASRRTLQAPLPHRARLPRWETPRWHLRPPPGTFADGHIGEQERSRR